MKKIFICILMFLLLTACTNNQEVNNQSENNDNNQTVDNNQNEESTKDESIKENATLDESTSNILVVYFSRTGEQYRVGVIEEGNTAIVAKMIAEEMDASIFEIKPTNVNYPTTYNELTDYAKKEQNDGARPLYEKGLILDNYDTIFIGAPVWWGDWPMIMYTFFENEDLSNKTLIPFNTHEGSGLSGFDRKLQSACPNSTVKDGLAIRGEECQNNKESVLNEVKNWLSELGF